MKVCLSTALGGSRLHCAFNWKLKALSTRSWASAGPRGESVLNVGFLEVLAGGVVNSRFWRFREAVNSWFGFEGKKE